MKLVIQAPPHSLYFCDNVLEHHGIKGMRWGVRRFQNPDGSLTEAGRARYARTLSATARMRTSTARGAVSGALAGAGLGALMGGPVGAITGAVAGSGVLGVGFNRASAFVNRNAKINVTDLNKKEIRKAREYIDILEKGATTKQQRRGVVAEQYDPTEVIRRR